MFGGSGLRRRIVTGIGLAVVGVLGAFAAVAVAGSWNSTYSYLSSDTGTQTEEAPSAALSPNGDVSALWLNDAATDTTATSADLDARVDSGSGFSTVQDVGPADPIALYDSDYPHVAEDSAGDAVAVWLDNGNVEAAYRATGNGSFETLRTVDDADDAGNQDQRPTVAMDNAGDAVAVWEQTDGDSGWSVEYAVRDKGSATRFATPVTLTSGIMGPEPDPQVAVNESGEAVIVWVDNAADAVDYASFDNIGEGITPTYHLGNPGYSFPNYYDTYDPTVAIAGDGNAAVAWVQDGDSLPAEVEEADLPEATADTGGPLSGPWSVTNPNFTGSTSDIYEADPVIAMKATTADNTTQDDNTVALAFYDGSGGYPGPDDDDVMAFIRPSSDWGKSWQNLYSSANEGQDWIAEPSTDEQQPQIALTSSGHGDNGPLTMLWASGVPNRVDSLTSSSSGTFSNSDIQKLESGYAADSSCSGGQNNNWANNACTALASNPSGNLVALWQQDNASSKLQVAADCYQASATSTTGSSCNNLADATTPSTSTTTPSTTTPSTTTPSTSTTTPSSPTPTPKSSSQTTETSDSESTTPETVTSESTIPPAVAKTIQEAPSSGTILVKLPGTKTFVNADTLTSIPNGSTIDATGGHVQLTFALTDGNTETASFWGGEFQVNQSSDGGVNLSLVGGSFTGCPAPSNGHHASVRHGVIVGEPDLASAAKTKAKKSSTPIRSLWSNAKGDFTTKGKNGSAAVLGTTWLVRDQCDGTYFYVQSTSNDPHGAIEVTVYHPHRHKVKLKRGHSLLAPATGYTS